MHRIAGYMTSPSIDPINLKQTTIKKTIALKIHRFFGSMSIFTQ